MAKQTLLIVINHLGKGGAEILLVGTLPELNERYNVILVTLSDECDFSNEEIVSYKRYSLGFKGGVSFVKSVFKLQRIIKQHQPSLIHSHLVYSNIIARLACPNDIPLLYSIHSILSNAVFNISKLLTFLEKNTIKKNHAVIAVSEGVLLDYKKTIKNVSKSYVLHNYIQDVFFNNKKIVKNNFTQLKVVAVGNIKEIKNYEYLINAFKYLQEYNIALDIYGQDQGGLRKGFQEVIDTNQLPILFKGVTNDVSKILLQYDAYVLPSKHEGFGIAAVEAMATGLPLLLSDLSVLRDVTFNNAIFFDINDVQSFVIVIQEIFENKHDIVALSEKGMFIAKSNYSKEIYLKKLFHIYDETINN